MLIVNHTKCTASLHYYFLSEKKFPKIFFSWFWKTCEGYAEVHLLNPHLWKICWEIKLPYEYIFSSLWMSVSFGMLCLFSKLSVFTQEGLWTFIWIHPINIRKIWSFHCICLIKTKKSCSENTFLKSEMSHFRSLNWRSMKTTFLKLLVCY